MKDDIPRKQKIKFKPATSKSADKLWVFKIIIVTFVMSALFNVLSSGIMDMVSIWVAILILLLFILTGIVFDIVGMAVTSADESPFHSMAVRRVKYAKRAIQLIKNKEKVSNFCNDVVGDICGIISGSAAAAVVTCILSLKPGINGFLLSLFITASVAALTVGGKAIGKTFAVKYSNSIIYTAARLISVFSFGGKKK